jgi:hypothetical protein
MNAIFLNALMSGVCALSSARAHVRDKIVISLCFLQ